MNPLHRGLGAASVLLTASASPATAAVDFEKQIWPILEAKCVECHKAPYEENGRIKKPKSGLRLDAAWAILQGSENGAILKPGDADGSYLYEVTILPEDDDMFMPPKGDPLTTEERDLLKQWIADGAEFGGWEGNREGKPKEVATTEKDRVREHEVFYNQLADGVEPASEETLQKARDVGAQIFTLKPDSPLLRVDFLTGVSACTDEKLEALLPLKDQIAQLDLGRTAITDFMMNPK